MRPYYGSGSMLLGGGMTRTIKTLILINIGVFLLQIASGGKLSQVFGLCSHRYMQEADDIFPVFLIWQFFTYMFLHGDPWHLFFNMFILWMFGRQLESLWGEKPFLRYYLICGIGAGIANYLFTMGSLAITIGASGAIFGILVAFAVIYPEQLITVFILIFPLPPMKAKHVVLIFAGLELLFGVSGTMPGIAHFAHLGGAAVGYIYLKMWRKASHYDVGHRETFLSRLGEVFSRWRQRRADLSEREVDRILDKISTHGLQDLSWREKTILRRRSKK